jgi:hypothetical protein
VLLKWSSESPLIFSVVMGEPRPSTDLESASLLDHDAPDDHVAPVESGSPSWQKRLAAPSKLGAVERGLLGLVFVLFVLASAGFGLFAGESYKLDHIPAQQTTVTATATRTTTLSPSPTSSPVIHPNV